MRIEKRTIVITGASSGFGLGLKNIFQQIGDVVIDISRTGTDYQIDVSDEKKLKAAFDEIYKNYGEIDMLITCAGYGVTGAVELLDEKTTRKQFDVNFFGTTFACKYAIPKMRKDGKIIILSSTTALFPLPFKAYYCASKAAVDNFARCLKMELSQTSIQVTSICPGATRTKFWQNGIQNFDTSERYGNAVKLSTEQNQKTERASMSSQKTIKRIYKICEKKKLKPRYIIGREYKLFNFFRKVFTTKTMDKMSTRIFYKKDR